MSIYIYIPFNFPSELFPDGLLNYVEAGIIRFYNKNCLFFFIGSIYAIHQTHCALS